MPSTAFVATVNAIAAPALSAVGISATEVDLNITYAGSPTAAYFTLQRALGASGPWQTVAQQTGTTFADTGLGSSTTYFYRVAVTSNETPPRVSPYSALVTATTQPASSVPGQVTGLSAVPASGSVVLNWASVPTATAYVIQFNGLTAGTSNTPTTTIYQLTASSTYPNVTVYAVNSVGPGTPSAPISFTTQAAGPPGPCLNVVATLGSAPGSVVVTFNAPLDNGGNPITGYHATFNPGGQNTVVYSGAVAPITIAGIPGGVTGTVSLHAFGDYVGPDVQSNSVTTTGSPKSNFIQYIKSIQGSKVLSGQHDQYYLYNTGATPAQASQNFTDLTNASPPTSQVPALRMMVMNFIDHGSTDLAGTYQLPTMEANVATHFGLGGIVCLSIYSGMPTTNTGPCLDKGANPTNTALSISQLQKLLPGSTDPTRGYWLAQQNLYFAELVKLVNANPGIVIVLRWAIEANGGQNWYANVSDGGTTFGALFKDFVTNCNAYAGANLGNNVAHTWNMNQDQGNYMGGYPGAAYVDINSLDVYVDNGGTSQTSQFLAKLNAVDNATGNTVYAEMSANGVPFWIFEAGLGHYNGQYVVPTGKNTQQYDSIYQALTNGAPLCTGFALFCETGGGYFSIAYQNQAATLLGESKIVNVAQLPAGIN